jgi:hypothetical protein
LRRIFGLHDNDWRHHAALPVQVSILRVCDGCGRAEWLAVMHCQENGSAGLHVIRIGHSSADEG